MTIISDQKKVEKIVTQSGSSFYWGMKLLEKNQKRAMFSIYSFCRIVDDIADSNLKKKEKLKELQKWIKKIDLIYKSNPVDSLSRELYFTVKKFKLEKRDFISIIQGMKMDINEIIVYPSMKKLESYCDKVAGAVGCLAVCIFGLEGENKRKYAFALGRAFQFTNILRDLKEDSLRNRSYIPMELIKKYNLQKSKPEEILINSKVVSLCNNMRLMTKTYYNAADKLSLKFKKKNLKGPRIMQAMYFAIFKKICKSDWNISKKVKLSKIEKFLLILKIIIRG
ncbi:MAG: hypothetical protein CMP41_03710 [Rickettsiales bacterium]|nr:hypothetical protein [Rickettsiales bacterium]|tara:strand:+ start:1969 stop:2811 length:843 start_codon:yes stop_codon:yes gene_type:complete